MAVNSDRARQIMQRLSKERAPDIRSECLAAREPSAVPLPPRIPGANDYSGEAVLLRREMLLSQGIRTDAIAGDGRKPAPEKLRGNIENHIGYVRVPLGVAGPLRVNGFYASGDFYVPLATHEGTLVASINRGANLISRSGGAATVCISESIIRAPCFVFESMRNAIRFVAHVLERQDQLQTIVAETSNHCRLMDIRPSVIGKEVYLGFEYDTGDAAGQNMVTFATAAICNDLVGSTPVSPVAWYVEGNLSGDKKATMMAFMNARGKKVISEVVIPGDLLKRVMRVTPEQMKRYWEISFLGGTQSGSIGVQGHVANALTALFIACGQDAASIAEASVGITRIDVTGSGDCYVSVTLPAVIVGSVGGGTWLPEQKECLEMIGCAGNGNSRKLAEICAATALAGEVSLIAALTASEFSAAHARFGRKPDASKPGR